MAACLAAGDTGHASHRAAAALLGLPGFERAPIEISTTANTRRSIDAIIHTVGELPLCDVTTSQRVPCTNATRTLIDLAVFVDLRTLEIAADEALRRRLTTVARLRWRYAWFSAKRKPGIAKIATLLAERDIPTALPESALESRAKRVLRDGGLPPPQTQFVVACDDGTVARVDFAYPDHRVAIEVDGYAHHSGRLRWERDLARRNSLEASGWTVINVTSQQLSSDAGRVCAGIRRLIGR